MKKRILAFILVTVMVMSVLASCGNPAQDKESAREPSTAEEYTTRKKKGDKEKHTEEEETTLGEWDGETKLNYTYRVGREELGSNFNPHVAMTDADREIFQYISSPFVDVSIKTSGNGGVYQWVYEMATAVTDVTAQHRGDLTKYGVTLPNGKDLDDITEGYVYEISLNPDAKWENGADITANEYVTSMYWLLSPDMRNSGAERYYKGDAALAGAYEFYNSGAPIYAPAVPAYGGDETPDYSFDIEQAIAQGNLYINVYSENMTLYPLSLVDLNTNYLGNEEVASTLAALAEDANPYGYTRVTEENRDIVFDVIKKILLVFGISSEDLAANISKEALFYFTNEYEEDLDFNSTVGLYAVDDYTIRYVCESGIDFNLFLNFLRFNWLVYLPIYRDAMDNGLFPIVSYYGTNLNSTVSYGPYKLETYDHGKQAVLVQNENWYGWEKNADGTPKRDAEGNLISFTNFEVDGERVRQYITTKIQIDVMKYDHIKNSFLKGDLSEFTPAPEELSWYSMSDKMMRVDEEYTLFLFMNHWVDVLQFIDGRTDNVNSIVLSNDNFRRALSMSFNRAEFAMSTPGYEPAIGLMNSLYHYDLYNDPESSYRNSEAAMQATVDLYGVEYGEDKTYKNLEEAYYSITGYNLSAARSLMKTACEELVSAGLYTEGENINIRIAWSRTELTEEDEELVRLINQYVNEAIEGSGFGRITFEAVGNVDDRYDSVFLGEYAMGYGAWGGDVFDPFSQMKDYCDVSYMLGQMSGIYFWNPNSSNLTIRIDGTDVTMTWHDWSGACTSGEYADADYETKLYITATMEAEFLKLGLFVPLFYSTNSFLVSYQLDYYTYDYNILYGFGGLRLMKYNYDDATWAEVIVEEGGTLHCEW